MNNLNRHDFLKSSSLASAGILSLSSAGLPFLFEKESEDVIAGLQKKAPAHWILDLGQC